MSWGPWQYEGLPEIGDWIKIDCENKYTKDRRIFEGMVIRVTKYRLVEICPKPHEDEQEYGAIRWAKKALTESIEVTRKATVDA
jgi:hypothetical protein